MNKVIYLDNNATTFMPNVVLKEYINWTNRGNSSSSYAVDCKNKIKELKDILAKVCNVSADTHHIIITSGASESNAHILKSVIDGYTFTTGFFSKEAMQERNPRQLPHIIASEIEHKSILLCLEGMKSLNRVEVSLAPCDEFGFITAATIEPLIKDNTTLISVMAANNETGAINDIQSIAALAHKYNIPMHSDYTQKFGKFPPNESIDAFSLSFHKIYGPPGIGALIIKKDFYEGLNLKPLIYGTQNDGLRGGTENISSIAAVVAALKYTFADREKKNFALEEKKKYMVVNLAAKINCLSFSQYKTAANDSRPHILFISGAGPHYLPSTLLMSIIKKNEKVCNIKIKKQLEDRNIIVGIGSACNTKSKNASHVVEALGADDIVKRGILRISISDNTTIEEIKKFNNALVKIIM